MSVTGGNAMVTARIELEEVDDALATKRGNVGVLCWALEKGLIKVRLPLPSSVSELTESGV